MTTFLASVVMILLSLFLLPLLPVLLFLLCDELTLLELLTEPDDDATAASFVPSTCSIAAVVGIMTR